ncbi:hypothetical protein M422DRAFT_32870, partial [Sphaerobolus stellatus SS14]
MDGVSEFQKLLKDNNEAKAPCNKVESLLKTNARRPPLTLQNFWKHIEWKNVIGFIIYYSLAIWGVSTTKLTRNSFIFSIIYYYLTGFAITAGYHRLWAHRSYNASLPLQYFFALLGAGGSQRSIAWWASKHRAHHRYTDTDLDPYGAHTGLIWAHFGWLLVKAQYDAPVDRSDLMQNQVVRWQHKYYAPLLLIMSFGLPMAIAGYGWNDWRGGFVYPGVIRLLVLQHVTWCTNSLAHYIGHHTFDDRHTPRDHFITAFITFGEGYHNYHHQFPMDYRNGTKWYHYDLTKWGIYVVAKLGLASHLRMFPDNEIKKAQFAMDLKKLKKAQDEIAWPPKYTELPVLTWEAFQEESMTRPLVLIAGFIHDVSLFIEEHPGGRSLLTGQIGKDATSSFFGGVYDHSNAAHNLLSNMRVGVLECGVEVISEKSLALSERLRILN